MKRLALCAILLAGPAYAVELTPEQVYLLTKDLNDPESARVRNVEEPAVTPGALCGEINWQGQQGGYVGYRKFWMANGKSAIEGDDLYKVGAGVLGCS